MKRTFSMILVLLLLFSLSACDDSGGEQTPTESQGGEVFSETVQRCSGVWYQDPMLSSNTIEVQPDGICVINGQSYSYSVVSETEEEVVLNADEYYLQIYLNPNGVPELHLSTEWDNAYLQKAEYWEFLGKEWYSDDGDTMVILAAEIHTPTGSYTEFAFDDRGAAIEVFQDEQAVCSITLIDSGRVSVTDPDGNEKMYYARDLYYEPEDWEDGPMDEQTRLGFAYDRALSDFNAAISGQPVYDEEGKEIVDGPTLAQYLYDQFVALGTYEDASFYLPFFKTRTEIITTEHGKTYSYLGELVNEYTIDYEIPNYDVFGRLRENLLLTYGIQASALSNDRISLVRDANDVVRQVNIQGTRRVKDDAGQRRVDVSIIADLEYNEKGLLVASHVTEQNGDGYSTSYTTTFEYDSSDRCIRIFVPHGVTGTYETHQANMYLYDEVGNLVQQSFVLIPADPNFDGHIKGYALEKMVWVYQYNELGLLVSQMSYCYDYRGGGESETHFEYDEFGRLIYESYYGVYHGLDEDSGYSWEEIGSILDSRAKAIFYPLASDEVTYEDWLANEPIDLSKWEWIALEKTLQSEEFYTYDKTVTIMYIDLTPDD